MTEWKTFYCWTLSHWANNFLFHGFLWAGRKLFIKDTSQDFGCSHVQKCIYMFFMFFMSFMSFMSVLFLILKIIVFMFWVESHSSDDEDEKCCSAAHVTNNVRASACAGWMGKKSSSCFSQASGPHVRYSDDPVRDTSGQADFCCS